MMTMQLTREGKRGKSDPQNTRSPAGKARDQNTILQGGYGY